MIDIKNAPPLNPLVKTVYELISLILLCSDPTWSNGVFDCTRILLIGERHVWVSFSYHIGLESIALNRSTTSYTILYNCH